MTGGQQIIYRFGEFELEPRERRLKAAGRPLALTPKAFEMLVLLVERADSVQSKEVLMSALWPRGYVDEATLSNHVWQIRRALGDTAKTARYIETVPKVGYRFVGQVCLEAGPGLAEIPAAVAPPSSGRHWRRSAILGGIVLALSIAIVWVDRHRAPGRGDGISPNTLPGRVVALVAFDNLSKMEKDAWLDPALIAMFGTELGAARKVRIIPSSLVRDAARELEPPLAGGYSRDSLAVLRRRLEADYVLSGSYLIGNGDNPRIRVDVVLQAADSGEMVASMSREVDAADVTHLVESVGAALRARLDGDAAPYDAPGAASQPPSPEVARHMGIAIDALQRHDPAMARDELLEAIALAPGYSGAYLNLARAWSALGYRRQALAAATQAASHASNLPDAQRLEVEAVIEETSYRWSEAAARWQALLRLEPESLEARLSLMQAEIDAGRLDAARQVLSDLRRLPHPGSDPRIELAAARLAEASADPKEGLALAKQAVRVSQSHELPGLAADAEVAVATSSARLGDLVAARSAAGAALDAYRRLGNRIGEAAAHRALAGASSDPARAREEYQQAMSLAQGTGDMGAVGSAYRDLCELLWLSGDRDSAQAAARRGLKISQETGDLRLQAWTLRALATIAADERASDEVLAEYREVTELTVRSHDRGGHAWSLATNADFLRVRGQLDDALQTCASAQAEAAKLSDSQFAVNASTICAEVDIDRGRSDIARATLDRALQLAHSLDNKVAQANAELLIGQIEVDDAHWLAAREHLDRAAGGFASAAAETGEADCEALLAIVAQVSGDAAARDRAAGRAAELRRAISSLQEVYSVDILLAQLKTDAAQRPDALRELEQLAHDAEQRRWIGWSLEAKLARLRLLRQDGSRADEARRAGEALEEEARRRGFGRIARLAQGPASPAQH